MINEDQKGVTVFDLSGQLDSPLEEFRKEALLNHDQMAMLMQELADIYRAKAYDAAQQAQEL